MSSDDLGPGRPPDAHLQENPQRTRAEKRRYEESENDPVVRMDEERRQMLSQLSGIYNHRPLQYLALPQATAGRFAPTAQDFLPQRADYPPQRAECRPFDSGSSSQTIELGGSSACASGSGSVGTISTGSHVSLQNSQHSQYSSSSAEAHDMVGRREMGEDQGRNHLVEQKESGRSQTRSVTADPVKVEASGTRRAPSTSNSTPPEEDLTLGPGDPSGFGFRRIRR
mmetsp:Transcript_1271/g.2495  ORF Transcript_1271/g.2495 Transcript_1271/m.2495 type:complete len:226 (+) Transcript_1271:237-914(+)